jgi:hypothetical protein|tara:strand:- start:178 stop:399 length:222 start_codon:yes stop_codon:yes gene_type:complete
MKKDRRMIPETLQNTEDFINLRQEMIEDLVQDELDQPVGALMDALETYLIADLEQMDDDDLQFRYENYQRARG